LRTENVSSITTPLLDQIKQSQSWGHYDIRRIQASMKDIDKNTFYDVQILAMNADDEESLKGGQLFSETTNNSP
jgi:hypothetical protein